MITRIIIIILCFKIGDILSGQESISKVTYNCITNLIIDEFGGETILYFTNEHSLYIHVDAPEEDKFEFTTFGGHVTIGDTEGWPVYMNFKKGELVYKTRAARKIKFILTEPIPAIKWRIGDDQIVLNGFNCMKATGEYGGRKYDVWFTPEIPISGGPYKLNGLPGMILQAQSIDGKVRFDFVSYEESIENDIDLAPPSDGVIGTLEDVKKMFIDRMLRTEAMSTSTVRMTDNDPPSDCEIEKDKWTYIAEYKKERRRKRKKKSR